MSISIGIVGIVDFDKGKFKNMLELKRLCDKNEADYPKKLCDFFDQYFKDEEGYKNWKELDNDYIKECMGEVRIENAVKGEVMYGDGAIVDLSKLPEGIKFIKVSVY